CSGLTGPAPDAVQIDSAALQAPSQLVLAERAPTPAARIAPANPAFCKVLGHIEPVDPKAPPIRFEVNLPLEWNGRSLQYGHRRPVAAAGLPLGQALAAGTRIRHLRHGFRSREQERRAAATVCAQ